MSNAIRVGLRFAKNSALMKDHEVRIRDAIEFASCNLIVRYGINILEVSFDNKYNCCDIELTCKEKNIKDFSNIARRLRGIAAYLCKKYPEEYNSMKVGTRLFYYWVYYD